MAKKQTVTPKTSPVLAAAATAAVRVEKARVEKALEEKSKAASTGAASTGAAAKKQVKTKAVSAPPPALDQPVKTVVHEVIELELDRGEVAELAYLYWEARGFHGGSEHEDWLRAEAELRHRAASKTSAVGA